MLLDLLFLMQAHQQPASDRFRELTIREIYAAYHPRPNWEVGWQFPAALGDHDRDRQMDFTFAGAGGKPNFYRGQELIRLESGLRSRHAHRYDTLYYSKFIPQQGNQAEGSTLAMLTSPSGPRIAILNLQAELTLWDLRTRSFLGIVPVPPPPVAGLPGADVLTYVTGDTDLDCDGWSDLFFMDRNGGYGIVGVISGRTLQPLWQHLQTPPASVAQPVAHASVGPRPDFDGDGVPDFLFAFVNFFPNSSQYHLGALSGATGALIWQLQQVTNSGGWATPVPDVTYDGVPDVVVAVGGRSLDSEERAWGLDGRNGALLWSQTGTDLFARLPPIFGIRVPAEAGWCQPSPTGRTSSRHEVWYHLQVDDSNPWTQTPRNAFIVLDPATGEVLDTVIQQRELHPWRRMPPGDPQLRWASSLGDIDRDGLIEYAMLVRATDVNDPNIPGDPHHLVIYGQTTLLAPAESSIGAPLTVALWIPSAPHHEAWLIASEILEGEAGLELDGWRTRLGPSALRSATVNMQPGRTALDSDGRGTLTMALPNWPSLAGKRIFLRAIVEQPGGEIWTMSSIGSVKVH